MGSVSRGPDIRAMMAMLIAALAACGTSEIYNIVCGSTAATSASTSACVISARGSSASPSSRFPRPFELPVLKLANAVRPRASLMAKSDPSRNP